MIIAALMFTLMVSMVKHARAELSALHVIIWRGVTALPLSLVIARPAGFRVYNRSLFALRVVLGFGAMLGYFVAAKGILVADLSLISKLHPILVALAAPLVLGKAERAGGKVWLVVFAGIAGCALILAPDLAVGSVYGLYCLGATCCSAGAHLCIRGLMRTDDARVLVFYFQCIASTVALGIVTASSGGLPALPPAALWPYLIGIGVTATCGQLLMTYAYKLDRAVVVSSARYAGPVWAVLADVVIFATIPGWNVFVGGAIIVSAGLVLLYSSDA